jgi:3',5'-cyclic AMP phosphodiesterase CpdA
MAAGPHLFRLGIVTDLHIGPPNRELSMRNEWALSLLATVVRRFNETVQPDAVAVLGDILADGSRSESRHDLAGFRRIVSNLRCPYAVLPGNHDMPSDPIARLFGPYPKRLDIGPATLLCFDDRYRRDESSYRHDADLQWAAAQEDMRAICIALQHAPLWPDIDDPLPYNLTNRDSVAAVYQELGVRYALAGHFHKGAGPATEDDITYIVAPSVVEPPFRFGWLDIRQRDYAWTVDELGANYEPTLPVGHV